MTPAPDPLTGPGCEALRDGFVAEPVSFVTSLAFVVAGAVILARARFLAGDRRAAGGAIRDVLGYAALVAGIGVGSLVQHGPDPAWADVVHDAPLLATLAYVGADSAADLAGRRRPWWGWVAPTAALLPVVVLAPRAGDLAQVGVAVVAVALTAARAVRRPALRRRIVGALTLLAVGGVLGTLSREGGPLCWPGSVWQGHGAWHVLASAALVVLAPVVTTLRRA